MELLGIATIFEFRYIRKKAFDPWILMLLLAFVGVVAITSFTGVDPMRSIWGNYFRDDGLFTLYHLVGLAVFLLLFWEASWEKVTVMVLAWSSALVSMGTVMMGFQKQFTIFSLLNGNGYGWVFGQPKFLGGYLLVTFPLVVGAIRASRGKIQLIWLGAILFQLTAIIISGARSAWIGIALVLLIVLTIHTPRQLVGRVFAWVAAGMLVVGIAGVVFYYFEHRLPHQISAESHERIAMKGMLAFEKRLLTGWGWSNFDAAFASVDWPYRFEQDVRVDKAHGQLLEVAVATGILGLLIYIGLIARSIILLRQSKSSIAVVLLAAFVLYLFHSQTNVISISEELLFWVIVGISGTYIATGRSKKL